MRFFASFRAVICFCQQEGAGAALMVLRRFFFMLCVFSLRGREHMAVVKAITIFYMLRCAALWQRVALRLRLSLKDERAAAPQR